MSVTKMDDKVYKILELMKLETNKLSDGIQNTNLSSLIIKTMRFVDKMPVLGNTKKDTVVNILLLLINDYSNEQLVISTGDLEEMIEHLYSAGILMKKKCC